MNGRRLFDHYERFFFVALVAAALIAAGGVYLILHRAAPIVATPAQTPTPAPAAPAVTIAPAVQPSAQAAVPPGPAVYRCEVDGTTTYSDAPCPGAKRIDASPGALGYAMPRARPSAPAVKVIAEAQPVPAAASDEKSRRDGRCQWIEKAIEAIDVQARQGLSAYEQDRLRADRRRLVDERYALKC